MTKKIILLAACVLAFAAAQLSAADAQPVVKKVLFMGNSITKHLPSESLGWTGRWGMAASAENKDYVHLFLAKLAASQGGAMPEFHITPGASIADKVGIKDQLTAYKADLAIVQLGENDKRSDQEGFQAPYEEILKAVRAGNPKARIICLGVWLSGDGKKDAMIRAACEKFNATFADLSAANADPRNRAGAEKRFTHAGVNWHPGDKGMEAYATALWSAYKAGDPK